MSPNKFEIELESKIDNLPAISSFIEENLERLEADPATINKVQLAIDEASTNVMNYAYQGAAGPLKIILEKAEDEIIIRIQDKGKPFDPTTIPPPNLSQDVEERTIGGLGFFFIKKIMDSVSYAYDPQEGNSLILKKKLVSRSTGMKK